MNVVPLPHSSRGLVVLAPERTVTVTGEQHHQDVLAGRTGGVVVALVRGTIRTGKHAGQRGVEVVLDGRRVGELTLLMSERYLPLLDDVVARGGRPGCEALLRPDHRGVQVELRLPAVDQRVRPASAPTLGAPRPAPVPTLPAPRPGPPTVVASVPSTQPRPGRRRVMWAGLVTVGVLCLAGTLGNSAKNDDPRPPTAPAAAARSAVPTTTSTTAATTSASTASPSTTTATRSGRARTGGAVVAPNTRTTARTTTRTEAAEPAPRSLTTTTPTTTRAPKPAPDAAASGCDPNYSGCVPIASDVDCEGGNGNGPAYVKGPVRVIGKDIYRLDVGGEPGIGCE